MMTAEALIRYLQKVNPKAIVKIRMLTVYNEIETELPNKVCDMGEYVVIDGCPN